MTIDTGFDAVIAGEVFKHPEPEVVTATVTTEPPCEVSSAPPAGASTPKPILSSPSTSATPAPTTSTTTETASAPQPPLPTAGLTAAGQQAALSLISLPDLTWPDLSKLAREIAMNLKETHVVLKDFKLTQVQYDFLEQNNDYYREALHTACREWHSPRSTTERLQVEAAAILEDSLIDLGARMRNKGEGLPGVIEAAKFFAKVAGAGEPKNAGLPAGERFSINIDLGGDKKVSIDVGAPAQADAPLLSNGAISDH